MSGNTFRDQVPLTRQFPILRVFDAALVALSPGSILIATLAAVVLNSAVWLCDRVLVVDQPSTRNLQTVVVVIQGIEPLVVGESLGSSLGSPWSSVARSAIRALMPDASVVLRLNGLVRFLISVGLWSVVGVILCRRSALLLAGNDEVSISRAIDYGFRRSIHSILGPLIPLLAAIAAAFAAAVIGLIGQLPTGGSTWLYIVTPIVTGLGFFMGFLFVATLMTWPLMSAAIATDDCDSFGALSRSYSMVTGRPWLFAVCCLLSLVAGTVLMAVIIVLGELSIWFGVSAAAIGSGVDLTLNSLMKPVSAMVREIVSGVGTSFFWSAATLIYLLLRSEVDGVPFDRVAMDDFDRPVRDPLPVVGIPATDVDMGDSASVSIEMRDVK